MTAGLAAIEAAELQDHLLMATHDMDRLQRLLDGACDALLESFARANEEIDRLGAHLPADDLLALRSALAGAVTGLQFQDMASQLITHTLRRMRSCADRLASTALNDDEDGAALIEPPPTRPNPVTQDEMDAGSVELF